MRFWTISLALLLPLTAGAQSLQQVNVAVASVAQAAKETETSTTQTLQAASQLALLAKDLTKLIGAPAR